MTHGNFLTFFIGWKNALLGICDYMSKLGNRPLIPALESISRLPDTLILSKSRVLEEANSINPLGTIQTSCAYNPMSTKDILEAGKLKLMASFTSIGSYLFVSTNRSLSNQAPPPTETEKMAACSSSRAGFLPFVIHPPICKAVRRTT